MNELLPWLNLLLLPAIGAMWRAAIELGHVKARLVELGTLQAEHQRRLSKMESELGDLDSKLAELR